MGLMFISDGSDWVPYLALHDAPHHVHRSHSPHECRRHCCQSPRVDSQERIDLPTREDLQIRQSRRTRQFVWFHATVLSVLLYLRLTVMLWVLEMCEVLRAKLCSSSADWIRSIGFFSSRRSMIRPGVTGTSRFTCRALWKSSLVSVSLRDLNEDYCLAQTPHTRRYSGIINSSFEFESNAS